jgi:hypothetical protein
MAISCIAISCSAEEPFVATDPYVPTFRSKPLLFPLDGRPRHFNFGGDAPFVNPGSGVSDIATINFWDTASGKARVSNSLQIKAGGVPGRVFKQSGYTSIGYVSGDGIVEGALRTQINSFPIPERRTYSWKMVVRFAEADPSVPWVPLPRGTAPATVWQLKPSGSPPSLVMVVDTDPEDASRLMLHFDHRIASSSRPTRLGQIGGLGRAEDISVRIESFLDERTVTEGDGFVRIWVNEELVVDKSAPTLLIDATHPPAWSIGVYMYSNKSPLTVSRFTHWREARMLNK